MFLHKEGDGDTRAEADDPNDSERPSGSYSSDEGIETYRKDCTTKSSGEFDYTVCSTEPVGEILAW